nr:retrovirus-related Pol polyprotein from transposon TNT 1-94 [Tanacetum cinerariifolium]
MDLCGPMRIASINEKRYVLVIVDDYSHYMWNGVVEQRNRTLVEAARTMLVFSRAPLFLWAEAIATACFTQNRLIIHRRFNKTPYELINGKKPDISFLYVFGALCYPKNDREDIGKLDAKGDICFFIGYSADSCAYRIYNRRTKKIIETMNVSFDELSAMAFEQRSSKPGLQLLKLNNCYNAPSIVRGGVSLSCLLDLGFNHTIASNGISISLNGLFYFSVVYVNGVFEIDMNNNVSKNNNNSVFSINKKRKLDLDSSYLWHCRLAHIGKTRRQKLQREGLLESINDESFDKCESCISGR